MYSVDELCGALFEVSPVAADPLEIAALSESLGITDDAAIELGYGNVFDLAEEIFETEYKDRLSEPLAAMHPGIVRRGLKELMCAGKKLSIGLGYSLPWILLTAIEALFPHALDVPPAFGSALSLAIIASLITTGGFVQAIMRDAAFFLALKEPFVARRSVLTLMKYGMVTAVLFAAVAVTCSFYFHVFSPRYLILSFMHYLLFSALWMLCAVISAQGLSLLLPVILLGSAAVVVEAHIHWHTSAMFLLLLWPIIAVAAALLCCGIEALRAEHLLRYRADSYSPLRGTHTYTLIPIALYGTAYFSFLFLDRLCAGSSVPWTSGLTFGVDSTYKQAMDTALLAFLLSAITVEYLGDLFMRSWRALASETQQTGTTFLSARLRRRYCLFVCFIALIFSCLMLGAAKYVPLTMHLQSSKSLAQILVLGGAGYLILSTTLFGGIVLLSVDAVNQVSKAAAFGALVNFIVGYTLSHAVATHLASMGLLAGSCVFAWGVHRSVWRTLEQPDYYYSLV
jgi:hypothetical protein